MTIQGKVWKYGNDVNTDVIFPGKYTYTITDRKEMAAHALEDLDPTFAKEVQAGDIVVAGSNFGCGSSREQAATCLKEAGVAAVIAASFARIFFRNAINEGLPLIECPEAIGAIEAGQTVEVDFEGGILRVGDKTYQFPGLPESVMGIVREGGLIPYVRKQLAQRKA
ncbi:MAG TPA: 3-isopropylmalate dehydratase small subunit [Polyangiaceae bacterium]|jgi:3-isopropylmalate/(R)-2-methylmalate dehydratase small subunit|nr:MAG: 2,3-dimethylmalate dehydratase small subunit [Deltaproteobacteria bacterium ADurb.Bin207]HNS99481.1 3-isopropylmalate dehydratase small subunit [Polyangiaceae bacterium]HNZ24086.1 3-isopropylmalate dehydratase small subunit [Polyangiaceae bacterium]HOD21877.1 3-isopropylmalate dehydratase small subunit [Polyangiaceae bacterium]HOE50953.1 3-isopropylmalate dehydratase small subunit [Polyangiaceae bacterium]